MEIYKLSTTTAFSTIFFPYFRNEVRKWSYPLHGHERNVYNNPKNTISVNDLKSEKIDKAIDIEYLEKNQTYLQNNRETLHEIPKLVNRLWKKLNEEEKIIVYGRYALGLEIKKIESINGISIRWDKSKRIREKIRETLGHLEESVNKEVSGNIVCEIKKKYEKANKMQLAS